MAGPCIHGFAPGTCLICQTLEPSKVPTPTTTAAAAPRRNTKADGPPTSAAVERVPGRARRPAAGPRVVPTGTSPTRFPTSFRLLGLALAVVIVALVALTLFHLVFALVLRLVELVGVAIVSGYLGWKAGVHHGRRTPGH